MSGETEAISSHEGDKEEEEEEVVESDSPRKGRKKKRAASEDPKGEASKRWEGDPPGQFGLRCRTGPQKASQGEAPGRIVSI